MSEYGEYGDLTYDALIPKLVQDSKDIAEHLARLLSNTPDANTPLTLDRNGVEGFRALLATSALVISKLGEEQKEYHETVNRLIKRIDELKEGK